MDTANIVVSTISRQFVSLLDPDPATIRLGDIGASLARQCRYNGHVEGFYSVAEHSVYVSRLVEREGYHPKVQLAGLLHDAHEAYIGDITQPVKELLARAAPGFLRTVEDRLDAAICERFRLDPAYLRMIKPWDRMAYNEEMRTVRWDPNGVTAYHILLNRIWFWQAAAKLGLETKLSLGEAEGISMRERKVALSRQILY